MPSNDALHIVFTTRQFSPCIGGTETYLYECAHHLVQRGYRVTFVTLNRNLYTGEGLAPYENIDGIEVFRVPFLNLGLRPIALCNPFWLFGLFRRCDLIQNADIRLLFESCLLAKFLFRKPLVITSLGYILHQKTLGRLKKAVFRYYYKPLFRLADSLQAISLQDADKVADTLTPEKITLVLGGVNTEKFGGVQRSPSVGRLLYFGRLDAHKGVDLALQALAKIPENFELRLVFASFNKTYRESLERLVGDLGLEKRVVWLGKLDAPALAAEIAQAQLVLFPSRYEGYGLTTLEAMAVGAVVVANTIDAFENIVEAGKTGFLVPFEKPETTAEELRRLMAADPTQLRSVSQAAASAAREQSWATRATIMVEMYRRLLSSH